MAGAKVIKGHRFEPKLDERGVEVWGIRATPPGSGPVCAACGNLADAHQGGDPRADD